MVNQLEQMFVSYSKSEKVNELITSGNSESVPKWSEFAATIVSPVHESGSHQTS